MDNRELYFIGIIPPEEIAQQIENFKMEMKLRFKSKHALKSPAHITLQMPFRKDAILEMSINQSLEEFASEKEPFEIRIDGFDSFKPRVIFADIENKKDVQDFHASLLPILEDDINLSGDELTYEIHPHITIATRDLNKKTFYEAWNAYEPRTYKTQFMVNNIHLLKHDGTEWKMYKEYSLNNEYDLP